MSALLLVGSGPIGRVAMTGPDEDWDDTSENKGARSALRMR
jgi:hypothetical protein